MFSFILKYNCFKKELIDQEKVQLILKVSRSTSAKVNQYDERYQYLEKSNIPTMHFQSSLRRLQIPKLADTCKKYLNAQRPLLSAKEFKNTSAYVDEFLTKDGIELQKELVKVDHENSHTSYISEPWFDMYLRDRKPLPINYNPFLVLEPTSDTKYNTQLVKATNLVISSLRFMKSLKDNVSKPETFCLNSKMNSKIISKLFYMVTTLLPPRYNCYGAYLFKVYPLDMSQYHNLFNSTRIPKITKDEIYQDVSGRHIIVMRKGHFYSVDVIDENGYIYEPKTIAACLKSILEDKITDNETPIGILTTSERNLWANVRTYLLKIGNQEILQKIDSAIFMMILDDICIGTDYNKLLETYLHADGTNRWFDKSFSLIVTQDGYAGINFEHSWGDGVAVLRFLKDINNDMTKRPNFHPDDIDYLRNEATNLKKLEFFIDDKVRNIVNTEKNKFKTWTEKLSIDHMILDEFGTTQCKTFGVYHDAIMQLAFQLAIYYQKNCAVPTYESCSTALFKHGRTEAIRPCTMTTKATCEAMVRNSLSTSELKQLIIKCSNQHKVLTKEAIMGRGFDRHLFALKKMWERSNTPKLAIFEDPAYDYINHNILSTSTLSDPAICVGGFGPVVNDGYGIGYMIRDEALGAVVTSYRSNYDASEYVNCLKQAFKSIHKVISYEK